MNDSNESRDVESYAGIISANRYRILRKLGAGGMGEVYLAEDTKLDRKVALKILPTKFAEDKERMSRFVREAKSASSLNHPNIITIHEIGVESGTHFIATEFIDGKTLSEYAKSNSLNLKSALEIAIQIASALDEAHSAGIVHRDIKPDNVMIRPNGLAKILDFGIAKLSNNLQPSLDEEAATAIKPLTTAPGMIIGTANYMSPEQAKGKDVDARSDIFSFGVVLYEMISGNLPFKGEAAVETIGAILHKEPKPLKGEVPYEIKRIIGRCLKKDVNERYQTIKDVCIELKEVKQDLEFQEKFERPVVPNQDESKTQILQTATADETNQTTANQTVNRNHTRKYLAVGLAILLISAIGFGYWFFTGSSKQIESIAVLPFVNEGGNSETEYLSDGMTETLIGNLSQLPNLSVKARSSVFRYKGKETNLQKIAQELNVQAVLTGRVLQRGEQLILNLELVDGKTENVIWTEQYNRRQFDLVLLQSEIARDVSNKLRVKLSGAEQNQISKHYTMNSEAYQLYLKGRFFLNNGAREGQKKSIEYFKQAINLDPNFALGYAGVADAYTLLGATFDASLPPREAMPSARTAAQKALELDSSLSEARTSLAWIKYRFDWDWRGAEDNFKQAIALNPNNAQARHWYADYLTAMGRFDEALTEIKQARELDPFSLFINWNAGRILYFARRYDEALAELHKTLEMDQNFVRTHAYLQSIYLKKGMNDESFAEHLKVETLMGTSAERIAVLKNAYDAGGWKLVWQKKVELAVEDAKNRYTTSLSMAFLYTRNGDKNHALEWLNRAYEEREGSLVNLNVDPFWDELRADPRFQDLLRRMNLLQ